NRNILCISVFYLLIPAPNVPRGTFVDFVGERKSMNRRRFDGSLKELRVAHRKFAAASAAHQHPSLRAPLHERPLALRRQVPQHQHAIAIGTRRALGDFRGRVSRQDHGTSSRAKVAAGDVGWNLVGWKKVERMYAPRGARSIT